MSRGLTSLWRLLATSPGPACYAIIDDILILSHLAWTQEWKKQEGWFCIDFSLDHPWLPLTQGVNPQNNSKSERGTLVESVLDSYFLYFSALSVFMFDEEIVGLGENSSLFLAAAKQTPASWPQVLLQQNSTKHSQKVGIFFSIGSWI